MRFVLIHGAMHGAWCWQKLVPELEALGHSVAAIDLPGHGERRRERATLDTYRKAVADVLEDGDVVVGHSMGGYVMTLGVDAAPGRASRMIFLAGGLPIEGRSIMDTFPDGRATAGLDQYLETVESAENGSCLALSFEGACLFFYHDCTASDQEWAFENLCPQPIEPITTAIHLESFWNQSIPSSLIACTDDRGHPLALVNDVMRRQRMSMCLGIDASHSPFISRPRETAFALDLCAKGVLDSV